MESSMQIRSFHCPNCGSPLEIPKGISKTLVCPYCNTESVIEGLIKNTEILQKENINSGIPLTSSKLDLHRCLIKALTCRLYVPLDILREVNIIKEEHLCIPAYLFYCSAFGNFIYDAGNARMQKNIYNDGKYIKERTTNYTEWTQMSGSASSDCSVIVTGNKNYQRIIDSLYESSADNSLMDPTMSLVDIEELEYPGDVDTFSYNMPQSAAFQQYCKPIVVNTLLRNAANSLKGKLYRNLSMGGTNVQMTDMTRIFVGVYRITYVYKGREYVVYISGDGKRYGFDGEPEKCVPIDETRLRRWNSLRQQKANLREPNPVGVCVCIALLLPIFIIGFVVMLFNIFIGALFVFAPIAYIFSFIYRSIKYKSSLKKLQGQLDAIDYEVIRERNSFTGTNGKLKGIYSNIK